MSWVRQYAERKNLPFPPSDIKETAPIEQELEDEAISPQLVGEEEKSEEVKEEVNDVEEIEAIDEGDLFEMYVGMYKTAIEMVVDEQSNGRRT